MISSELIVQQYQRDAWVIEQQVNGLSHQDSLLQLPFRSNCLNWVLGHIVVHRDKALQALGKDPTLNSNQTQVYQRGSDPILDQESAVPLATLLEALEDSQKTLLTQLQEMPDKKLATYWDQKKEISVGERIIFLQWHEAYHIGQLEILRQLAGKDDKIIA